MHHQSSSLQQHYTLWRLLIQGMITSRPVGQLQWNPSTLPSVRHCHEPRLEKLKESDDVEHFLDTFEKKLLQHVDGQSLTGFFALFQY